MKSYPRLLRPLDYLRIEHPEKRKYDFYIPLALSAIGTIALACLPFTPSIFGKDGVVDLFTGLLQILTGFYIASLAAVSTFSQKGMDEIMVGQPPTLKTFSNGKIITIQLTRRRFLSLMFGYLALVSIFLYFLGGGASLLEKNAKLLPPQSYWVAKWTFLFIYFTMAANLLTTTLLSLFYMADRIHRPNPELIPSNEQEEKK